MPMDPAHWIPVSMAQEGTDAVFDKVKAALERDAATAPTTA
jgi:hypothetical protein